MPLSRFNSTLLSACLAGLMIALATNSRPAVLAQDKEEKPAAEKFDAAAHLRSHYTKREFMIPMRDGVRLFTSVFVPKDDGKIWPILLLRTPYGVQPYGEDNLPGKSDGILRGMKEGMLKDGYIFAFQDVRGRMGSEGEFVHVRPYQPDKKGPAAIDESSDTYDTIDWLVKNVAGNNGKVGMWGISYPGFYSTCGLIDSHPALKAVSPQAPVTDWFIGDDFRHNGAVFLPHGFNFLGPFAKMRPPTPVNPMDRQWNRVDHGTRDGYDFFLNLLPLSTADAAWYGEPLPYWQEILEHDTYDDYWKARDIRRGIGKVGPAVLTVGGWFDAEDLFGTLATWRAIEKASPASQSRIVMGPWVHGGWGGGDGEELGKVRFDAKTAEFYREKIEQPFFAQHLKGEADPNLPEAYMFETGTNQWRRHEAWPPKGATPRTLWLDAGGILADHRPAATGFDEYVSDPFRPVPFIEGVEIGMAQTYMIADQRFAARRPDVLVYQTAPFETPLTAAGPIEIALMVSTSATDSDWVVKVIDVYPNDLTNQDPNQPHEYSSMGGYQQLVRGEPFRGRFRNSFSSPEPFVPGEATRVAFRLPDVYHTFKRGHRLMVQVQSSWFPLVDRNPQNFVKISTAVASDYRKATQRVHRGGADGSSLTILSY